MPARATAGRPYGIPLVPEGGGVFGRPFEVAESAAVQDISYRVGRRAGLAGEIGQRAEQPVGHLLGQPGGEHPLTDLVGGYLHKGQLPADGLADGSRAEQDRLDAVAISYENRIISNYLVI
jgi:hypothetical protein